MIVNRRHMLMGLACTTAAGAAFALTPRQRLSLAGDAVLDTIIPRQFADWKAIPSDALITPEDEDGLAKRLYSQVVGRLYSGRDGTMVMLLIAYGNTQNDLLQLHRPEVCYPAFGFEITRSEKVAVPLYRTVALPARALTAYSPQRTEQILYWTRIGEHLPTDGREQRVFKLEDQLAGVISDGVLVRISVINDDPARALVINREFARAMVYAIPARYRAALIGSKAAGTLAAVPMPRAQHAARSSAACGLCLDNQA